MITLKFIGGSHDGEWLKRETLMRDVHLQKKISLETTRRMCFSTTDIVDSAIERYTLRELRFEGDKDLVFYALDSMSDRQAFARLIDAYMDGYQQRSLVVAKSG